MPVESLKKALLDIPFCPGVYQMLDDQGRILYIGKAIELNKRIQSYTRTEQLPHRLKKMVHHVALVKVIVTQTEVEALLLEANLIKKHRPEYNVLLKDDKSMNYITLSNHAFPLLKKQRYVEKTGFSFGPFPSANDVSETLALLHQAFLLRSCSDFTFQTRKRPCLQYYIKRCSAPCVGKISAEGYGLLVQQAIDILKGKSRHIQNLLAEKMSALSASLEYEQAALMRDRIKALNQIQERQTIHSADLTHADILALIERKGLYCLQMFCFRHGANYGAESFFLSNPYQQSLSELMQLFIEQFYANLDIPEVLVLNTTLPNEALLKEAFLKKTGQKVTFFYPKQGPKKAILDHALQNAELAIDQKLAQNLKDHQIWAEMAHFFDIKDNLLRIEIYDNSHLRGTNPVSAMVAATPEGFDKKGYRLFSALAGSEDDYEMMRQVFARRLKYGNFPDLFLVDGGKGQVSCVFKVLEQHGLSHIPLIGISKGADRKSDVFYRPLQSSALTLPAQSPLLFALQRLRDEAHRFAVSSHRKKRTKSFLSSQFDAIPGVGQKRRQALFHYFGTFKKICHAQIEDLMKVPGISKEIAQKIYDFFDKTR
jgi:excinuclease ABC subunit C